LEQSKTGSTFIFQKSIDIFQEVDIVFLLVKQTTKNKIKNMKANLITDSLNTMTRDELRAVAIHLNVPRGKEKNNTVSNLAAAIHAKKVRFSLQFTLRPNTDPTATTAPTVYSKKLRTHKPDKIVHPVTPLATA